MANNSPNTTIPFTVENRKTLDKVDRLYDMIGNLTRALRDDRETREQAINDMSKKIDKFEKYIMVDYAKNIKMINERLDATNEAIDELENRYDDLNRKQPRKETPGCG